MPSKDELVQVKMAERRKKRWKREAAERAEYRSLTDLVVTAVENELREEPVAGAVDVDLAPIHDRLDAIRDQIGEMDDTIDETYMLVRSDTISGYDDLRERVQELIPTGDREEILGRTPDQSPRDTPVETLPDVIDRTGSVSHLARLLQREGHTPVEIKGVVEQLAEDVGSIEATYARPQEESDKRVYRVED